MLEATAGEVIVIVGPTAVGKTAAAVELVERIRGEIISADSMAVYRGMDIGAAKPTAEERERAIFHLIDVADPAKPFSVGDFMRLAHEAIDLVLGRNPPAIVVGGSGLYVRAAVDGLDESMPAGSAAFREELWRQAREQGSASVHARLAEVDPASANFIHPNNLKRVIRALEIYHLSGRPLSAVFEADSARAPRYPNARFFGLAMNRETLYSRIERRVDEMIKAGLIEEVRRLTEAGVRSDMPSTQGLGYKEVDSYLRGEIEKDDAIALLKKNTRRFAKRQYTWFRADNRITWLSADGQTPSEVSETLKELINEQESS